MTAQWPIVFIFIHRQYLVILMPADMLPGCVLGSNAALNACKLLRGYHTTFRVRLRSIQLLLVHSFISTVGVQG